jgi:dUTP pyrophosphatase
MIEKDTKIQIKFKTKSTAELPEYKTVGSAGFDIKSIENKTIEPGKWALISTGLSVEIPKGYEIQVRSRSGLAFKSGIFVLNSPGTIDSDYRGEIGVILANFSEQDFKVSKGDRIAQLVVSKVYQADILKVEILSETKRGNGGFGHTGIK